MQQINFLGQEIRNIRKESNQSLQEVASNLKIDRSYLNKIELGLYKPSPELLTKIIAHFSVEGIRANQLRHYIEHGPVEHVVVDGKDRKAKKMTSNVKAQPPKPVQVAVDPDKVQVLYSDSIFVGSSDYGLVLDVAQSAPGGQPQQFIVARIGMSFEHAKKLLEVISDHLQKNER